MNIKKVTRGKQVSRATSNRTIDLKKLKESLERIFINFIKVPKEIKDQKKEKYDKIEIKLKKEGKDALAYWEEGTFPIGMIEDYEKAFKKAEKLLNETGMNIEIYSSFQKIENGIVFLGKGKEEDKPSTTQTDKP